MAATLMMPSALPRSSDGKASVMMALALANRNAPPTPWNTRPMMIHKAPPAPFRGVRNSSREKIVKTANPRLYILTRPYMSPTLPRLTTSTAVTSKKPVSIHKKYDVFDEASGSRWMPRKMSGREISRIDWLMVTINMPSVVFDSANHL
jgi:hypothetical protein